jgi:hypothetical protein
MKLLGALTLITGIAGGYLGARQLLAREDLAERVPEPIRPAVTALRGRLLLARKRAGTIVEEYERERASAETELMRDYYTRVGRPLDSDSSTRPTGT